MHSTVRGAATNSPRGLCTSLTVSVEELHVVPLEMCSLPRNVVWSH